MHVYAEPSRGRHHHRTVGAIGLGVAAAVTVLLLAAGPAAAQADGEALFRQNCANCHGATGAGVPGLFPPLAGNPHVDDADYVAGVIRNGRSGPIEVLGATYDGQMPAFPNLTDEEIEAIIAHVQTGLAEPGAPTTTLPPLALAPVAEGVVLGERLFVGRASLEAGGPACAACHTAGQYGDLSGVEAGLASDLSRLWARTGDTEALAAAVREADTTAMHAVYADRPLTGEELSALASFFEEGVGEPRTEFLDGLLLIGAAVFFALVAATLLVTANRRERTEEKTP
jgi:mono/diheme cytochrome c family protein